MYKLIKNRRTYYIISGLMLILAIIFILVFKLRLGIDYKGGTIINYQTSNSSAIEIIENSLKEEGVSNYSIKPSGNNLYTLKMGNIDNEKHQIINNNISAKISDINEVSYDNIGPTISRDLTIKSILAVIIASITIIIYIAFAFRKLPRPLNSWKFGSLAVFALIHDLTITIGLVAILSHFLVWMEVDALFTTALLTIMGFSVHDTIVIYDRLRENFIKNPHKNIDIVAEESVNQTLARSINTSMTTIIVLLILFLLGGTPIRHFVLILIIGIFIGTYSSIFVAAPLVVSWHKIGERRKN